MYEVFTESGCDTGKVEPIGPLKDSIPIEVGGLCHLDGGILTVIDTDRASLRSTLLEIVDTHSLAATDDRIGIDTEVTEGVYRRLPNGMVGGLVT